MTDAGKAIICFWKFSVRADTAKLDGPVFKILGTWSCLIWSQAIGLLWLVAGSQALQLERLKAEHRPRLMPSCCSATEPQFTSVVGARHYLLIRMDSVCIGRERQRGLSAKQKPGFKFCKRRKIPSERETCQLAKKPEMQTTQRAMKYVTKCFCQVFFFLAKRMKWIFQARCSVIKTK